MSSAEYFSGNDKPGEGDVGPLTLRNTHYPIDDSLTLQQFMMFFPINSLVAGSRKEMGFKVGPNTKKWWERVMARPACKKGMERLQREEEEQISSKSKI